MIYIKLETQKNLAKIAKKYAEEHGYFWGEERDFFIKKKEMIFHKNYLVFNSKHLMGSDYYVTLDKKTLQPYKISPFGNIKPDGKN